MRKEIVLENKKFIHNLVEKKTLKQVNIDGKRWYVLPDGKTRFKSVTTVLSEKSDNTALFKWRKRVGNEEANKVSALATKRGTSIHSMAERYVLNEENVYGRDPMPTDIESFNPIREVLNEHVDNIRGVELKLYSKALQAAGTTDLVADYDNIPSIIDFKTSLRLKKEEWIENYFLQSTIYSMMMRALYGIPIEQIVIIISVDHEPKPQIFIKNPAKYVNKVIEMFTQ